MKAIETKYKGYRFRSRLEAKWAVAFDEMGIEWDYEPQGYQTDAGGYLPDFMLKNVCMPERPGEMIYVEVKGKVDERAIKKAEAFGFPLLMIGDIPFGRNIDHNSKACPGVFWTDRYIGGDKHKTVRIYQKAGQIILEARREWDSGETFDLMQKGFEAARSARFEFGESGSERRHPPKMLNDYRMKQRTRCFEEMEAIKWRAEIDREKYMNVIGSVEEIMAWNPMELGKFQIEDVKEYLDKNEFGIVEYRNRSRQMYAYVGLIEAIKSKVIPSGHSLKFAMSEALQAYIIAEAELRDNMSLRKMLRLEQELKDLKAMMRGRNVKTRGKEIELNETVIPITIYVIKKINENLSQILWGVTKSKEGIREGLPLTRNCELRLKGVGQVIRYIVEDYCYEMEKEALIALSDEIRKRRKAKYKNRNDFAKEIGHGQRQIGMIENGDVRDYELLREVCAALEITEENTMYKNVLEWKKDSKREELLNDHPHQNDDPPRGAGAGRAAV